MLWIHYNYNSWIINNNKTSIKTFIFFDWSLKKESTGERNLQTQENSDF